MKKIFIYIFILSTIFACQKEVKKPQTVMEPVLRDTFTFTNFNYPQFSDNLESTFDIYSVVSKEHEFRFGPHDSEYG
ncbi:MAG: hypothetical protein C0602_00980, partial [Denitrovibrio sp.]